MSQYNDEPTGFVPSPPADWLESLRDLAQVKNYLNGDSVVSGSDTPVCTRLHEFFLAEPGVSEAWERFNRGRPRLR